MSKQYEIIVVPNYYFSGYHKGRGSRSISSRRGLLEPNIRYHAGTGSLDENARRPSCKIIILAGSHTFVEIYYEIVFSYKGKYVQACRGKKCGYVN